MTPAAPRTFALEGWLDRCKDHAALSIAASLLLATIVAAADYATGDEIPLIVCYLPSVLIMTWVSSAAVGATLAAACCTAWLADDLLALDGQGVTAQEAWTAAIHAVFFVVLVGMLTRLRIANENERRLARTDGLTGLLNAKAFRERAEEELARSVRREHCVSVAFIDCDNFKTVNDTLGHLEGDRLLAAIAAEMQESVRKMDVPARMGGDEFAVLLPETTEQQAEQVIARMRERLDAAMAANNWPVTFSIGVAVYETPPRSVDELIHGADELMYEVKADQKDAVVFRLVA
ncbi:putative diguanylate cyclase AdrA [Posidoniimonas corsicana]|uniref:diguanylate cyclase n=1 Tax=Posidoniimonas corsicana TaxID=1938618 RepID=A0A5C5VFZ0_9BACT|nr:GGDEF domain-containing protein [Posidoniimonas corsicana]TWT36542.1 putative diguanylate cyclase AdrA [Posidoniimonas corsicana]